MKISNISQKLAYIVYTCIILPIMLIIDGIRQTYPGIDIIWPLKYPMMIASIYVFTSLTILFLITLVSRKSRNTLGKIQLALTGAVRANNARISGPKKYIFSKIFACLLSFISAFFIYKILVNIFFNTSVLEHYDDTISVAALIVIAVSIIMVICTDAISLAELREHGIIYGFRRVCWSQIDDYRWSNEIGYLFAPRASKGYATLQASCKGLLGPYTLHITIPQSLQSDVNQVFASKLPPQASDVLMIPDSGWNLGFSHYKINHLGIANSGSLLAWDKITACQWKKPRNCYSLMSFYLRLRKQQKYRILQVEDLSTARRAKPTEIAVPNNLFEKVNEKLTKYLPTHVPIQ
jgi:hypothetical protein